MQAAAATFQQQTSLAHRAGPKTIAGPSAVARTTVLQQQQRRQPRLTLTRQQHRQPVVCAAAAAAPAAAIAALQELGTSTTTTSTTTTSTTSISLGALVAMAQQGQLQVSAPEGLVQHSRKLASRLVVPVLQDKPTPITITLVVRQQQQQQQQQAPTLTVVGGSGQRLSSLLAFVSGSDSLAGGRPWASAPVQLDSREDAFIRWDGKTFQQLPQATRQRVEQYRLNCVVVHEQRTVA